jgi:hypothetical protein
MLKHATKRRQERWRGPSCRPQAQGLQVSYVLFYFMIVITIIIITIIIIIIIIIIITRIIISAQLI